jgi:hypothetical protein
MDDSAFQLFKPGKRKRAASGVKIEKPLKPKSDPKGGGALPDAEEHSPQQPERARGEASTSGQVEQRRQDDDNGETSFKDLGLSDWLCGVLSSLGIAQPTPVQRGCIPAVLAGRDVIGTAQTGSGKTAAFALPILQRLAKDPFGVFALVLTPTRWAAQSGGCPRCTPHWRVCRAAPADLIASAPDTQAARAPRRGVLIAWTHGIKPNPCRELAVQLAEQFRAFGAGMNLRVRRPARGLLERPGAVDSSPALEIQTRSSSSLLQNAVACGSPTAHVPSPTLPQTRSASSSAAWSSSSRPSSWRSGRTWSSPPPGGWRSSSPQTRA